ncbi:DUF1697 domain-containing protein [Muricauda sp. SCSIO 64092]|uniref:DUF1697 domain-containing protein n=1 Tax=Allomuricauda sp. SCSIO 64092 TaxID=2908842 RepID=UPI001FF2BF1B|nr:DUF1697 domain-containing protein [Muricauda sp. SCSIO 64092]UOY04841.1 DUF1697 domain-containing protein [Muricauda sp. SCSIO 64092]
MNTYLIFLRGINVSGQKKIRMVDLKEGLEKLGFKKVRTYIQSGNIVLETPSTDHKGIEADIKNRIKNDFGFDVPVLLKTITSLQEILRDNPFKEEAVKKNLYFTLLYESPTEGLVEEFNKLHFKNEDFHIAGQCVYLHCKQGAGKAKLNNNLIENKLRLTATTRNLNTMLKMIALAEA